MASYGDVSMASCGRRSFDGVKNQPVGTLSGATYRLPWVCILLWLGFLCAVLGRLKRAGWAMLSRRGVVLLPPFGILTGRRLS